MREMCINKNCKYKDVRNRTNHNDRREKGNKRTVCRRGREEKEGGGGEAHPILAAKRGAKSAEKLRDMSNPEPRWRMHSQLDERLIHGI